MLARKYDNYAYDNYAWEEQPLEQEAQQPARRQIHRRDPRRALRNRIIVALGLVLLTYLVVVTRSEAMVQYGNQLLTLRNQETQLINKNNELKIEVEQLKGPERIIGLAEKQLGMSVARSNIYVKAAAQKNNFNSLALANK